MTTPLCLDNLSKISATAATPGYARSDLSAGIVHFGTGNFHRAHQAVYLDKLFNAGHDHDWAIVGASVMPADSRLRDASIEQDFLSTVVEQSAASDNARVTGSMIDFMQPGDTQAMLSQLINPAIRIVSLTITEGGYFIDPATGLFDSTNTEVVRDSAQMDKPQTVFGLLSAALKSRHASGALPFTVMSCDNIPHNGAVARNAVVGITRLSDPEFADWIEKNVAFPNSMVDRITPATSERERQLVKTDYQILDSAPVFCEDFCQWVLEDKFTSGRPSLEKVGVEFVDDVSAYELTKIRMLNGGHALIAYPAALLDIEFVHHGMEHPLIAAYLAKVESDEIIPIVPDVPEIDKPTYLNSLQVRFSNPKIADTIQRLCYDGSNRQPKFIVPSIADRLNTGGGVQGLALGSALWCRYCYGETESGQTIESNDPSWSLLVERAHAAKKSPEAWLAMKEVYAELGASDVLNKQFSIALRALWEEGVESVLSRYSAGNLC